MHLHPVPPLSGQIASRLKKNIGAEAPPTKVFVHSLDGRSPARR
ncbi:DUF6053 domain-containing protein [Lysobacter gummosus]